MSLISFFHKMFDKDYEKETLHTTPRRVDYNRAMCDKCGAWNEKKDLTHIDAIDEDLCVNCIHMMKLARGEY
jgi:hypothetical protein